MTLALPNPATRFPQAVAPLLNQKEQQYVLIDIAARSFMEPDQRSDFSAKSNSY
jgi:hypothetical protein